MKFEIKNRCIGLMSGTSLDGLDIADCTITKRGSQYSFEIDNTHTYNYNQSWRDRLKNADKLSARELIKLDRYYGDFLGISVLKFMKSFNISYSEIDFIASHGHTVFHQPESGFTLQIGAGSNIASKTNIQTICNFRSRDVAEGGQGAPLVPIGDALLFQNYDYCLNLGGFANLSFDDNGKRTAFDICPLNIPLNIVSNTLGLHFDNKGNLARSGQVNEDLLRLLNELDFYKIKRQKSLGKEWFDQKFNPLLHNSGLEAKDQLATLIEHFSDQISSSLKNGSAANTMLVTGGGTYNKYLIEKIMAKSEINIIIPNRTIIDFKEALLFGFLGFLRLNDHVNALSSVTGAKTDSIGGAIYHN